MPLHPYGPDDDAQFEEARAVVNAALAVDAPWDRPRSSYRHRMLTRYGWDGEPEAPYLLRTDAGATVGVAGLFVSAWDNPTVGWATLVVDPAVRGRGHGTAGLDELVGLARGLGLTHLTVEAYDTPAARRLATGHGFAEVYREANRMVDLDRVDPDGLRQLTAEAAPYATDYETVRLAGAVPQGLLGQLAALTAAINDAPTDDLVWDPEEFPPARIRDGEAAQLAAGWRLYRVVARRRDTGTLAGHTKVLVDAEDPTVAIQLDTAVARAHRGHRLGLLLKAEMMAWLRDAEPGVLRLRTSNASSNAPMIGVNEQLGYRLVTELVYHQRTLG